MKKRIANGIQLIFMLVAFIILWIPCIKIQHVDLIRYVPIDTHAVGIMANGSAYILFAIFAVTALMCIISIVTNPEHKDGKMHIIMPIILFLYAVSMINVDVGSAVGTEWKIAESNFPVYLYLGCLFAAIVTSIVKRSSIITGLPSTKEKTVINNIQKTSNADELKKYKDLLENGTITQEEFDTKKKQLLGL